MNNTTSPQPVTNPPKFKRKKLFVDGVLQGRAIRHVCFYWTVYHLFLWNTMFLYSYLHYRGELLAGGMQKPFLELYRQFSMEHYSMLVCALAILPLVAWDILVLTHKISGPIVRFQRSLKQLARGERITPVQLRKGDLLVGFQDTFNAYVASLDQTADKKESTASGLNSVKTNPTSYQLTADDGSALLDELREMQASLWETCDGNRQPESATERR
ncbi:MAG: hypothetical protein HZA46_10460 [Planctomycetales bacterium]|nr:hypothetical protein [Planctomycetales bacterium]